MNHMRTALIEQGIAPDRPKPSKAWACLTVRTVQDIGEKVCLSCEKRKPLDAFYRNPHGRGGRRSYCKPCYREYERERRAAA